MTEPADIARAFNEWTPGRKDLEIATLRARVDELERSLREIARMAAKLPSNGVGHDIYNCAVVTLAIRGNVPTPDPRDARIAEVEQAAIQWRLRMAELETEAQESDARIAVLEAALREARGDLKVLYMATGGEDADMMYLIGSVDERLRRILGEEPS